MIYVVLKKIETSNSTKGDQSRFVIVSKDRMYALHKVLGPVEPIAELKGAHNIHFLLLAFC